MSTSVPIRFVQPLHPADILQQALEDQQRLTAVDRFARQHESGVIPDQAKFYQELIPFSKPKSGEQYAFEVNLDACTGCKACVSACHSLNGLDEGETWRSVGLLQGGTVNIPFQKTVTTACHHCLEPACLSGCPTQAYVKDAQTGIVKHLDDQCIGCKYCTLTCPYEVPQYNARLGIVRKCDMCQSRLAADQAPACVQACPNQAIRIKIVKKAEVRLNAESDSFLPGAPKPEMTGPTTDYKTASAYPRNLLPADYYSIKPSHPHLPLVFMLVLTQLSVGTFVVQWLLNHVFIQQGFFKQSGLFSIFAFLLGQVALGASLFHLGRPLFAFRAMVGLRTSWLSREILAFTLFSVAASIYAASFGLKGLSAMRIFSFSEILFREAFISQLELVVAVLGIIAVGTSVMVYRATLRPSWDHWSTVAKFYLTSWITGSALLLCLGLFLAFFQGPLEEDFLNLRRVTYLLTQFILVGSVLKLSLECSFLFHLKDRRLNPFKRSALLLMGALKIFFRARLICGFVGGIFLPFILMHNPVVPSLSWVIFSILLLGLVFVGEWLERFIFFTSESADRMPGAFS